MKTLAALVFPEFQTLDLFGPLEVFGDLDDEVLITIVAESEKPVISRHGQHIVPDKTLSQSDKYDLILIPGGRGTPVENENTAINDWIISASQHAELIMAVCTGGALLAKIGLLDDHRATTNKQDFSWSKPYGPNVEWVPQARWVKDGKFFTSSGVSAGIDMSLAVVAHLYTEALAEKTALEMEYDWHKDSSWDPFAKLYDLA